ncbi:MAG: alpha/beta hydrolase [Lachnospiraceae bacterium]|nr:alpha/beta hydrolase [Lachnospiraceae bacterium]
MGVLKNIVAAAGILAAAGVGETVYFYNRTMKRGNAKTERTTKMSGTDWEKYFPLMEERKGFVLGQPHEDVYITSFDGLKLHATYFPGMEDEAGRPADVSGVKKAVICFHGYTGEGLSNHIAIADYFLKKGYAMLMPDARAHGESEGEYIGFGCLDRKDALSWVNWLIGKCGNDVAIMLHGTSMGGATVLMASGLDLPCQVKGIVSDCGFTSPKEVFTHVLNHMYHLPAFPAIQGADLINKRLAGYGMDECNAKYEVQKAKVPILFIHGSSDTFVPVSMCHEIYENCASPKRKLIVEGAAHAESYYKDMADYEKVLTEFAGEIM